jgi:GMP synthase (glutamine-hydrolysing)
MIRLLIVNNAERGITEFVEPIQKILDEAGVVRHTIEYEETLNMDMTRYDGTILSGSPRGNDIVDHHLPYFQWIKTCDTPILGICAGHHITGRLYGSALIRDVEKEVGDFPVFIDQGDPIFNGYEKQFLVRSEHHDSITLPEHFIRLAHSERCRVSIMKHQVKPLYTTQFHPEVLNKNLILNFIEIVKNTPQKNQGV